MKKVFGIVAIVAALLALGFSAQPASAVGSIVGSVIDADNAPVAGAMVMVQGVAHRRGQRPFMARAESGEDGSFAFADVPDGDYVVGAMSRELGGARAQVNVAGAEANVTLQLQGHRPGGGGDDEEDVPMGSLTGVVRDAEGNPVEGARVMLSPARLVARHGMRQARRIATETDANGAFTVAELPAGVWVVMAMKRDVGAGRGRVEVEADAEANVEITLQHRE